MEKFRGLSAVNVSRVVSFLALLSTLAACSHAPDFERESPHHLLGQGPEVDPPASIAFVATSTSIGLANELTVAVRMAEGNLRLADERAAEYVVRVDVARRVDTSAMNLLICWPGFVLFTPVWHGLEWPYEVEARVAILRFDGARVAEYSLVNRWTAHYTPELYGGMAELGWLFPPSAAPAFAAALISTYYGVNREILDHAFTLSEGDLWAEEVIASISEAIVRDRRDGHRAETPDGN